MTTGVTHPTELLDLVGAQIGTTDWYEITYEQVNLFADATGDYRTIPTHLQWTAGTLLADPVTPAYLTLALLPRALDDLLTFDSAPTTVDYSLDKVRFPAPAPVDARIRCTGQVLDARQCTLGIEVVFGLTFQAQGACQPACVAELVVIYR
ncbi:MaoC/PaaZ C-terminal domain-containing protein [Rhodococcus wratislaviensis]|uniref:Putative enoyl-CoA hydratase n=1 Tax=Rhodococcus wratislaviensis NBRC 100605 TaxID=1219028 RepID=X0PW62_RHOWR|nr:MaoC/PaaZ C-terminal domain-containing protein [Rhodococcus wratislaviensis]GAF47564.1 putative enoyl-CoA hydratase [Rhodococcus wratislaviensis NBRC 100605]